MDSCKYSQEDSQKFKSILDLNLKSYARKREEKEFWKVCEGKQVLNGVARSASFSGPQSMILASFSVWERERSAQLSDELTNFAHI